MFYGLQALTHHVTAAIPQITVDGEICSYTSKDPLSQEKYMQKMARIIFDMRHLMSKIIKHIDTYHLPMERSVSFPPSLDIVPDMTLLIQNFFNSKCSGMTLQFSSPTKDLKGISYSIISTTDVPSTEKLDSYMPRDVCNIALFKAVLKGDESDVTKQVVDKEANINVKGPFDRSPLFFTESTSMVALLDSYNANLGAVDEKKQNAC